MADQDVQLLVDQRISELQKEIFATMCSKKGVQKKLIASTYDAEAAKGQVHHYEQLLKHIRSKADVVDIKELTSVRSNLEIAWEAYDRASQETASLTLLRRHVDDCLAAMGTELQRLMSQEDLYAEVLPLDDH